MTCNQIIALLEVYRTGNPEKTGLGTINSDLVILQEKGLVVRKKGQWHTTAKAITLIEAIQDILGSV